MMSVSARTTTEMTTDTVIFVAATSRGVLSVQELDACPSQNELVRLLVR